MADKRNSNIEVLRIISIFIIILNHYSIYGGFEFENPLSFNAMTIQFLHMGGKLGVDIFIFISGWFTSQSKNFNIKRIVRLGLQVLFYSVILASTGLLLNTQSLKSTIRMLGAIPFGNWIFITSYFMLFCLSPFLNMLIRTMTKKQYLTILIFLGITWCIFPTFVQADFAMSNTAWYIYIYMLAGFLRKYQNTIPDKPKRWLALGTGSVGLIAVSEIILEILGKTVSPFFASHAEHFRSMNSILILSATVFLFLGFAQLPPKNSSVAEKIASTSLAVFILHDNGALRPVIWTKIFHTTEFSDSALLILHAFATATIIFAVGCAIDLIRQYTIEKAVLKPVFALTDSIESKYNEIIDRFCSETETR